MGARTVYSSCPILHHCEYRVMRRNHYKARRRSYVAFVMRERALRALCVVLPIVFIQAPESYKSS